MLVTKHDSLYVDTDFPIDQVLVCRLSYELFVIALNAICSLTMLLRSKLGIYDLLHTDLCKESVWGLILLGQLKYRIIALIQFRVFSGLQVFVMML